MIAAAVGAVAIVGAGIFAITRISGDSSSGGAASPEGAGEALLEAFGNEDVLGAIDVLLPGERETMRGPLTDLVDELRRLEVFSSSADLSDIGGVEIEVTGSDISVEETNVDDIANLRIRFDATASVNGDELPIGDLILDNADVNPSELDVDEQETNDEAELPVTVVRKDGRWYVSLFYTVAEQARQSSGGDVPELADAIAPTGGDSPEDAFDALLEGIEALDVEAIIAALNPNEFEALQRYAPLFLDDAQRELDAAGVEFSIKEPEYTVSGSGDTRSMTVSYIAGDITVEGDTVGFSFEDGCFEFTPPAGIDEDPINTCELTDDGAQLDQVFGQDAPREVTDFVDTLAATFDDYEQPGFVVKRVDGRWYVSPMATGAEQVLAVMRALDRDEIEQLIENGSAAFDELVGSTGIEIPTADDFLDDPGAEPIEPDETIFTIPDETFPDLTVPDLTFPDSSVPDADGIVSCYVAESVEEATQCYQDLFDAGEIESWEFPAYLRLPECGLAELWWSGEYYRLGDADFVAVHEEAKPCFEAAVEEGTIDEFDVPTEVLRPDCLNGVNIYASEEEGVIEDFYTCALG